MFNSQEAGSIWGGRDHSSESFTEQEILLCAMGCLEKPDWNKCSVLQAQAWGLWWCCEPSLYHWFVFGAQGWLEPGNVAMFLVLCVGIAQRHPGAKATDFFCFCFRNLFKWRVPGCGRICSVNLWACSQRDWNNSVGRAVEFSPQQPVLNPNHSPQSDHKPGRFNSLAGRLHAWQTRDAPALGSWMWRLFLKMPRNWLLGCLGLCFHWNVAADSKEMLCLLG